MFEGAFEQSEQKLKVIFKESFQAEALCCSHQAIDRWVQAKQYQRTKQDKLTRVVQTRNLKIIWKLDPRFLVQDDQRHQDRPPKLQDLD